MKQAHRLELGFDIAFAASLAQREKQIQQNYRPTIGIHKWFARRPGTVFRNLLLAEFNGEEPLRDSFWRAHKLNGVIADPFMGGGTTVVEANRLGFSVIGTDINPMAYWIVRQSVSRLDLREFRKAAESVIADVATSLDDFYKTACSSCNLQVPVKYFIWVKTQECPDCGTANDLFPGYLLAEAERHPLHVVACSHCGHLNEYQEPPTVACPAPCAACSAAVHVEGPASRGRIVCRSCQTAFAYPSSRRERPPAHRIWALEYHCAACKPRHAGRFFKSPDMEDHRKIRQAAQQLERLRAELPIPNDRIPDGDETKRLHRWGYERFSDMFNQRQLLGLGLLLRRIVNVPESPARHALLTVFSDFLRYQNMLCRYDTYALKCQDIFSVHGFPVALLQCENNLLGIPKVGSGAFRHFVEKYVRAKEYCCQPFETMIDKTGRKRIVPIDGESIDATLVDRFPNQTREAWLNATSAENVKLPPESIDGVFTDPPYYDNVQYAELMDFCYAWLRIGLKDEIVAFAPSTTKTHGELTGNGTLNRGLDTFTAGLSAVFKQFAQALKAGAPFVFTYHHNDPAAYVPLVVAILDADLDCLETLPAPAEMAASLHIARSDSSVLDTVFVCRRVTPNMTHTGVHDSLRRDVEQLTSAGMTLRAADIRCLQAGHIARIAINRLRAEWSGERTLEARMAKARAAIDTVRQDIEQLGVGSLTAEPTTTAASSTDAATI